LNKLQGFRGTFTRNVQRTPIQESSPVQWEHINLHGTFDFSKEALKGFLDFDIEELMNFNWNE
jgi:hypothetical protein